METVETPVIETPAPAPAVVDAATKAVAENDFTAFKTAENARLAKTFKDATPPPLTPPAAPVEAAPVEAPSPAPAAATEPKPVSKRQQAINDAIRQSVEAATRDKDAEIARLRALVPAPPPTPEAPKPTTQKDFERYKAMANAPKLADYQNYEDWNIDMAAFVSDVRDFERAAARQEQINRTTAQTEFQKADLSYGERIAAAVEKTPDFLERTQAFRQGVPLGTPIGDAVFHSPVCAELALHFSDQPDDFVRIARLSPPLQLVEMGRLEARFLAATPAPAQTATPEIKHVSSAPAPPVVLGSPSTAPADPALRAVRDGDFSAFKRVENARLLALKR